MSYSSAPSKIERKVKSIVTAADYAELEQNYRFLPDEEDAPSTWQERMVQQYHTHLYKDYVLADFQLAKDKKLGLRWRTIEEVNNGRGSMTCGNKHCVASKVNPVTINQNQHAEELYLSGTRPKSEKEESENLKQLPFGALLANFEVPFTYVEAHCEKTELVKLRLCARCAPLLFTSRGEIHPCLAARRAREENPYPASQSVHTDEDKQDDKDSEKECRGRKSKRRTRDVTGRSGKRKRQKDISSSKETC